MAPDGVMDSALALTLDTLSAAHQLSGAEGPDFRATLFCPGVSEIRTRQGARFDVAGRVAPGRFDALVIPGLGLSTRDEIGTFFDDPQRASLVAWLHRHGPRVPRVAAGCSAVFLLAEAGLLRGRRATTTWWLGSVFRERYPDVDLDETQMVVEDRGVVCAGAALAQIDLMLHLLARLGTPGLVRAVARSLAIEERPTQARYMMRASMSGQSDDVVRIERWMRRQRHRPFSLAELARAVGMSPRTVDRRVREATGHGAKKLAQRIRLEHAAHLLQTSRLALDEVAGRVGYRDPNTLRRLLKRELGVNPSQLRREAG